MDFLTLFILLMVSLIGLAYFIYGKKQTDIHFLTVGILLMVYPYFISNKTILIIAGIILTALPLILKKL